MVCALLDRVVALVEGFAVFGSFVGTALSFISKVGANVGVFEFETSGVESCPPSELVGCDTLG